MLLALDIGNSTISAGIFDAEGFYKRYDFDHRQFDAGKFLSGLPKRKLSKITRIVYSSVVPAIADKIKFQIKKELSLVPENVEVFLKNNVEHKYKNVSQLGVDRLLVIKGALEFYKTPFLVIDMGTAITVDYVNSLGVFEGGMIIPGVSVGLKALERETALLPEINKLKKPNDLCGKNTKDCMLSGSVYGAASMIDGLVRRFLKEKKCRAINVVITGGISPLIAEFCEVKVVVDYDLALRTLFFISQRYFS